MNAFRTSLPTLAAIFLALSALVVSVPVARAQAVSSLQLVPSTISGGTGGTATGIVTLAAPAPAGGIELQLDSSNPELAASALQLAVPAGQTNATFVVATNALYRRYSGQAFSANISAVNPAAGAAVSAAINVTVQARPTLTVLNPDTDRSGPVCAGDPGLLFNCPSGPFAQCTFQQECTNGCQTRLAQGLNFRDQCAAAGPYPIVTNTKRIVGGNVGLATLQLASGAPAGSFGLVASSSLVAAAQTRTAVTIPTGATSLAMPLNSAAVNRIQFAPMEGVVTTPQPQSGGSVFYAQRSGRAFVAVVPGVAPAPRIVSHRIDASTLRGGEVTFGTTCINQLAPAPDVGTIALSVSSSNSAVAQVPPASLIQGGECLSFSVITVGIAANTSVNINARLGAQLLTVPLLVTAAPSATQVNSFFLDPLSVAGGETSMATIVLNGLAPPSGFLVSLSSDNAAALVLPASVTIPAGTDRVNLLIGTNPVAADSLVTILFAPAAPGLVAQLTVRAAAAAPTLTGISVSPATVMGGSAATGRVSLSGPAQVASVVILSSSNSASSVPPSVTVPVGASSAQFVVNTAAVAANTVATLSATLGSVTRLGSFTVTPTAQGGGLAAPTLQSPANDTRFNAGQTVAFDWSDVAGAASYLIEIDNANTFADPLTLRQSLTASQYSTNTLPVARLYWRVRGVDANGNPGAWSAVRQLRVR
jgi:trimeric autotransporter adhesin